MRANWTMAAAAALATAALSGCALGPTQDQLAQDNLRAQQAQTDRMVQQNLQEATAKIGARLETIERLERGDPAAASKAVVAQQTAPARQMAMAADPLSTRVKIDWNGPVNDLLLQLSKQMDVRYSSNDVSPNLFVRVKSRDDVKGESAGEILQEVGRQLDGQADLIYDQEHQIIKLRAR
jgi:hypothetical protein